LDASITALHTLLLDWGQRFEQMNVFCDSSKPLKENQELFNKFVGRKEKKSLEFNRVLRPITYNISNPINFVKSNDYPGIQLADVIAYTSIYTLVNDSQEISYWREPLISMASEFSIIPDDEAINPELFDVKRNHYLFIEIMRRTINGEDVLEDIQGVVLAITRYLLVQSKPSSFDEEIPF
jgi:hypothetical protein